MRREDNPLRRLWWAIHSRWWRLSISTKRVHVCWWGATLGPFPRLGYVVLCWHAFDGPEAYTSPNGTPWHHAARSLLARRLISNDCSCETCRPDLLEPAHPSPEEPSRG